jgi:hypothetical protein
VRLADHEHGQRTIAARAPIGALILERRAQHVRRSDVAAVD